ncbi:MAG TPA: MBL fold metallo-hydrolase [Blastocatellia bacterium]|nr:MBL fold metallo-hydrolase [Blastocatellia bacterium]
MCEISRRDMLIGTAALLGSAAVEKKARASVRPAEIGKVDLVAPDVYFHEGNLLQQGHCNNGWIIFEDYVLVIDANFPSGAKEILPKIKAITDKPIRFALDTHHHGDHAYGNQFWVENGAVPLAHTGVIDEMKRYEGIYSDSKPGRWQEAAKSREDLKSSRLKPPSLLFPKDLVFDDGKHRVELMYLGVAHTHGDALAWLPKEKILFTGDMCVNGPYNYVGDGNIEKWIATLDAARKLGATVVCPGHGPRDAGSLLEDQQAFFTAIRDMVGAQVKAKKTADQIRDSVEQLRESLMTRKQVARYVGKDSLVGQVEKAYTEMTGNKFEPKKTSRADRELHAHHHGLSLAV